jgi:hypothetical protein
MRTLKMMYRLFQVFSMVYTLWRALQRGRWWAVGFALWKMLRNRGVDRDAKCVADITFVNAGEPAIYRRRGIRRITPKRLRV